MVFTILLIETISDIKSRSLSALRIAIYMVAAIALNLVFYYQSLWSMTGGMVVGGLMLLYAFITKEGIGYGDALMFVVLGALVGLSQNIKILFFSLLTAAVSGGIYALIKHKSIKTQIPFIPCILATYMIMCILEVVL